jgi:hypothetical protein
LDNRADLALPEYPDSLIKSILRSVKTIAGAARGDIVGAGAGWHDGAGGQQDRSP